MGIEDWALRESLGDLSHSEIVTRSEVSVMLGDHVSKSEHGRDLRDYVSRSDFHTLSVSKSEFSQLLGILYEVVPNVADKMRVLQTLAHEQKQRSGSL